ncbi:MAG: hypothetical protein KJ730_07800 [Proteobacteria bacterium]|nr:hypothetical protein [Pseudomonadota bacterium]
MISSICRRSFADALSHIPRNVSPAWSVIGSGLLRCQASPKRPPEIAELNNTDRRHMTKYRRAVGICDRSRRIAARSLATASDICVVDCRRNLSPSRRKSFAAAGICAAAALDSSVPDRNRSTRTARSSMALRVTIA